MVYAKLCILHNFMVRNTVDIVNDDQMNTLSMSQFQSTILYNLTTFGWLVAWLDFLNEGWKTALYMKPR